MVINVAVFAAQFLSKDKLLLWGAKVCLAFTPQALAHCRTPANVFIAVNPCKAMRHAPSQADNCMRQEYPLCSFACGQSCQELECLRASNDKEETIYKYLLTAGI